MWCNFLTTSETFPFAMYLSIKRYNSSSCMTFLKYWRNRLHKLWEGMTISSVVTPQRANCGCGVIFPFLLAASCSPGRWVSRCMLYCFFFFPSVLVTVSRGASSSSSGLWARSSYSGTEAGHRLDPPETHLISSIHLPPPACWLSMLSLRMLGILMLMFLLCGEWWLWCYTVAVVTLWHSRGNETLKYWFTYFLAPPHVTCEKVYYHYHCFLLKLLICF